MDLSSLNTDLDSALARLNAKPAPAFVLPDNLFLFRAHKAEDAASRRGLRQHIKPANAESVIPHLPAGPDDRAHCILRGDFVLCDLIPAIVRARGVCPHLRIATLSLSEGNGATLAQLVERGDVQRLTLLVSHYFSKVDREIFQTIGGRLKDLARLTVARNHAKVILIPTINGDFFSLEGSANLRSSDNLEQMVIFNDQATHDFHAAWIDGLADK